MGQKPMSKFITGEASVCLLVSVGYYLFFVTPPTEIITKLSGYHFITPPICDYIGWNSALNILCRVQSQSIMIVTLPIQFSITNRLCDAVSGMSMENNNVYNKH